MPFLETIGTALASIKGITELASKINSAPVKAELQQEIIDLQTALLTARQEMLEMQDSYERVLRENRELKEAHAPKEKPRLKWGCYEFEGEEGLFCTACYDSKGKKSRVSKIMGHQMCPVCKAALT